MIFWQTVLVDEREDRSSLRWPRSWQPNRDYLHRTGPIRQRSLRGSEYLTNDVAYVDLARLISLSPANPPSPVGGRPANVVKRLYPLDPQNRTFALSIVLDLRRVFPFFEIESVKPTQLPEAEIDGWTSDWFDYRDETQIVSGADIARWCGELAMRLRGHDDVVRLSGLGDVLATHLAEATSRGVRADEGNGNVRAIGHAAYVQTTLNFGPSYSHTPDLIIDQPPDLPGRPLVGMAHLNSPASLERRLRTYALRTFAEVEIGMYLLAIESESGSRPWTVARADAALAFLSRESPHAQDGEVGRRIWQMSVRRAGASFGGLKSTTRDRLQRALTVSASPYSAGNVVVMGDVYNVAQAGAVGKAAQGTIVNLSGSSVDLAQLYAELLLVRNQLEPDDDDVPILTEAIAAAKKKDAVAVEGKLKRLSKRSASIAKDLGVAVAAAAITQATGLS